MDIMVPQSTTWPAFPYGFATFDLTRTWTGDSHASGDDKDYNRAYGHLGATYGYQSIVLYFPAVDLSLSVASNMETDNQVQPSDVACLAYNVLLSELLNETEQSCTYVPSAYYGGSCHCVPHSPSQPPVPPPSPLPPPPPPANPSIAPGCQDKVFGECGDGIVPGKTVVCCETGPSHLVCEPAQPGGPPVCVPVQPPPLPPPTATCADVERTCSLANCCPYAHCLTNMTDPSCAEAPFSDCLPCVSYDISLLRCCTPPPMPPQQPPGPPCLGPDGSEYCPPSLPSTPASPPPPWLYDDLTPWNVQLVFKPHNGIDGTDLLSLESMRAMCKLGEQVRSFFASRHGGEADTLYHGWNRSPGDYAAWWATSCDLVGEQLVTCDKLTQSHVNRFRNLLVGCSPAYNDGSLKRLTQGGDQEVHPCTMETFNPGPERRPAVQNAIYDTLNALLDEGYSHSAVTTNCFELGRHCKTVSLVKVMVPTIADRLVGGEYVGWQDMEDLINTVLQPAVGKSLEDDPTCLSCSPILFAYEIANGSFKGDHMLYTLKNVDLPLVLIGVAVIVVMMWFYSGSILFTLMAWVQIILGLVLAYGIYELFVPFFLF